MVKKLTLLEQARLLKQNILNDMGGGLLNLQNTN